MDRQALSSKLDSENRASLIRRIETAQKALLRPAVPGQAWWSDFCIKEISYCSQMLCNVRPYQWADYDKAVK